jgi:hypothetical protein
MKKITKYEAIKQLLGKPEADLFWLLQSLRNDGGVVYASAYYIAKNDGDKSASTVAKRLNRLHAAGFIEKVGRAQYKLGDAL